jgi:anti-sigma factor (TIGR02949 family)
VNAAPSSLCAEVLGHLDRYIDGELDSAAASRVASHIELCERCHSEFGLRDGLRRRLRAAVMTSETAPFLRTRVLARLETASPGERFGWRRPFVIAAILTAVIAGSVAVAYHRGHLRVTSGMQESYITEISDRVPTILRAGLGDHVHCSVFRRDGSNPPDSDAMAAELGEEYSPLLQVVQSRVPPGFRVVAGHRCRYHGREFAHLNLRRGSQSISLIITRKRPGESFARSSLLPLVQAGLPIYADSVQRFHISGFETAQHLGYVVSDLAESDHTEFLLAVAPEVHQVLSRLDS